MKNLDDLVEVYLKDQDDFLKVRETLTRIGIASKSVPHCNAPRTLYQSCHILHKRGKYYIMHFKELFRLDGKPTNYTEDDLARRNTIVKLLVDWKLVTEVDPSKTESPLAPMRFIKVVPFKYKLNWNFIAKYRVGKSRLVSHQEDFLQQEAA